MAIELQPRGPAGANGLSVYAEVYSPTNDLGRDGEIWINASTGAVLRKAGGQWRGVGSIKGPRGKDGEAGVAGRTILYGSEIPPATLGRIGDAYIRDTNFGPVFYGPKGSTSWPAGEPIVAMLNGAVPPTPEIGIDGQSYTDTVNQKVYGPKTNGAWPTGVSFTGTAGLQTIAPWATGTAYTVGPPASFVSQGGASYGCRVSHTAGVFATDLGAGKWGLVAAKGQDGTGTGTVSTTGPVVAGRLAVFADNTGTTIADGGAPLTRGQIVALALGPDSLS